MRMNEYTQRGYISREDYLNSLSLDYNIDKKVLYVLARVFGEEEDFNELVTAIKTVSIYYLEGEF